ncbi:response regulator [Actinoplanes sp. NPDC049548]|uniref:response regulator n=1 Tax=Actinoplanes sp. NPDC049548 TaxID=3155152 RepID=UPI003418F736
MDAATEPVLVVEDDVVSRMILCRMLQQMGYRPDTATSVESALELAGSSDYCLIISDFQLLDGTGIDLLDQLPVAGRSPAPFILVTGIESSSSEADGWRHRVDAFLTKPVHSRELRACVERVRGPGREHVG